MLASSCSAHLGSGGGGACRLKPNGSFKSHKSLSVRERREIS